MLTKSQIAQELSDQGLGGKVQISRILDGLSAVAAEQLAQGEDFTVPGVARLTYTYRGKQAKGSRWKKGEERTGFGGIVQVADSDSPPVTEQVKLKATPAGVCAKLKPGTKPEAQTEFLKSSTGKAVRRRKG